MIVYLDTSALVKLYHQEAGSEEVENILIEVEEIYLSEIAKLEFKSAIWKKVRTGEVDEENALIAIDSFQNDFDKYAWIAIKPDIIASAQELLMTHGKRGLRTLDSIQLASILILKEEECTFITFDSNLKDISQAENLNVFE